MHPVFIRTGFERLEVARHPIHTEASRLNSYKHPHLTCPRRLEMDRKMIEWGWSAGEAAATHEVTPASARNRLGECLAGGRSAAGRRVVSSALLAVRHRAIEPTEALLIVELRRRRMTRAWIAASEGASYNTGSRLLERAGLYELCCLAPTEPVVHYEHERPGGLLQIDTKKLGPIERPSHSLASNRRESFDGAGWKLTLEDSIKLIST